MSDELTRAEILAKARAAKKLKADELRIFERQKMALWNQRLLAAKFEAEALMDNARLECQRIMQEAATKARRLVAEVMAARDIEQQRIVDRLDEVKQAKALEKIRVAREREAQLIADRLACDACDVPSVQAITHIEPIPQVPDRVPLVNNTHQDPTPPELQQVINALALSSGKGEWE
jgi:hypothetical protein